MQEQTQTGLNALALTPAVIYGCSTEYIVERIAGFEAVGLCRMKDVKEDEYFLDRDLQVERKDGDTYPIASTTDYVIVLKKPDVEFVVVKFKKPASWHQTDGLRNVVYRDENCNPHTLWDSSITSVEIVKEPA